MLEENSLSISSGCQPQDEPSSTNTTGSELLEEEQAFMEFFRARETPNQIFTVCRQQRHSSEDKLLRGQLLNYNRKEKSLEELSRRFLELYVHQNESLLELDKITLKLGVERRRIYDIINILESLKVVIRTGKNLYKWNGLQRVAKTIAEYESEDSPRESPRLRKEKSLEVLSIGFLKLFIHWRKALSLEQAAKKLVGEMEPQKLKTKVRRLYDIANVFKSLGLVKKTYLSNRKPGFEWVGVSGLYDTFKAKSEPACQQEPSPEIRPCSFFQEHIMKHFGTSYPSIQLLMSSWKSNLWSNQPPQLAKTRSMCETTAVKSSNLILKERTNERTADTPKSAFGSFRKIEVDNDIRIEPKVLF